MDSEYFVEVKIVFVNKVLTVSSMIMWSDWTWLSTGATHTTVRVEDSRPPGCRRQGGSRRPAPGARRGSGGRRWRGPRRRRGAGTGCVWRAPGPAGAGAGALQETCCRRDSPHPTESRHCSTLSASSSLQLLSQHHTSHLTTNHRHLLNTSFYSYSYRNY